MIYLSCLGLDPRSGHARADLRDPYQMHRTLSRAFGTDEEQYRQARCLFRTEMRRQGPRVLVQSRTHPEWHALTDIPGYLADLPETKTLELEFAAGQKLRFLLVANPTRREPGRHIVDERTGKPRDGARRALVSRDENQTQQACRSWLATKGERGGFVPLDYEVCDAGVVTVHKGGRRVPYAAVRFEGVLAVSEPQCFRETVEQGIGTGKGFGFGLLSLARA